MNITEDFNDFDWELWAETVDIDDEEILDEAVLSFAQRIKRARTMKRLAPRMKNLRRIKKFRMADKNILMKRARKQAIKMFRKKVAGEKGEHYSQLSPAAKISIDKLIQTKMPAVTKLAQRLLPKVRKAEVERLRSARKPTNEQLEEGNKAQLGIPANATNAQLRKIRSSDSSSKEQKQRAHWLLNMRKEEVTQDPDIKDRAGTQPKKYFKDLSRSTKAARDAHFKKYAKKDDSDPLNYKPAPGDKSAETKPSVHTKNYKKMYGESNGQTDDVADIVPDRIRISMISSSKKRLLNDKFEKMTEQDIAARVSGPSTKQTAQRHSDERQRLKDKHARERETLKNRQAGQKDRAQIRDIRKESLDEMFEAMQRRQQKASSGIAPRDDYMLDEKQIDALKKKAEKSGISYGTLKKVYDRGMAAWKSGHRPGTTPQQWAFARVNSFVTKSKGTWGGADKDLASRVKNESVHEAKKMPHALDPKKSLKHAMTDVGLDRDADGDVDILDKMKKLNPDEITGTEKNTKAIQSFRKKRGEIEKKHTRVGVAYEENSLDESFQMVVQQPSGYGQMVTAKEAGIEIKAGFTLHPSVSEEGGAGEFGTDKLVKKYKEETPGEDLKEESWIQFESCCEDCMEELVITEAEYQGKKVKLNDPIRTSENPKKKFKVYVRDPSSGNIKVVRFGDPGLSIKRDDPGRRRNFRARHNCDNPGPITKARYWSCRMSSKRTVSSLD